MQKFNFWSQSYCHVGVRGKQTKHTGLLSNGGAGLQSSFHFCEDSLGFLDIGVAIRDLMNAVDKTFGVGGRYLMTLLLWWCWLANPCATSLKSC